jgi:phosphatidylglycerophosphate synthase
LSTITEEFIEPMDGVVAKVVCYPIYSRLETLFLKKSVSHAQFSVISLFFAFFSGLTFYYSQFYIGAILTFLTLITNWISWRLAVIGRSSRFGIVLGSILDRTSEAIIISGIILSPALQSNLWRIVGVIALIGSLTVSYLAVRSFKEFKKNMWKGFPAYGATRDVRLTLIIISAIIGLMSWGLAALAILTFCIVVKRTIEIQSYG